MNRSEVKTVFGTVSILWAIIDDIPKIVRILLPKPGLSSENQLSKLYPNLPFASCLEIDETAWKIKGFLEGAEIKFSLDIIHLSICSQFQQSVLIAEHQIPWGRVSTYGQIAECLDKNRGARAVGNALATNPFPIIIPCHRAIRSDRHLGGYQGGIAMKRALLENEGIVFDEECRVISAIFTYQNNR